MQLTLHWRHFRQTILPTIQCWCVQECCEEPSAIEETHASSAGNAHLALTTPVPPMCPLADSPIETPPDAWPDPYPLEACGVSACEPHSVAGKDSRARAASRGSSSSGSSVARVARNEGEVRVCLDSRRGGNTHLALATPVPPMWPLADPPIETPPDAWPPEDPLRRTRVSYCECWKSF